MQNNGTSAQAPQHAVNLVHPPQWQLRSTRGVFSGLHATHAHYHDPDLDTSFLWTSRRHRKGRRVEVRQWPWRMGRHCRAADCAEQSPVHAGACGPREAQGRVALPAAMGLGVQQHLLVCSFTAAPPPRMWHLCVMGRGAQKLLANTCRWVAQLFTWGSVVWCVNVRSRSWPLPELSSSVSACPHPAPAAAALRGLMRRAV